MCAAAASPNCATRNKSYDYLLKFLLVGDSDVGKEEILSGLEDGALESPYGGHSGELEGVNNMCERRRAPARRWLSFDRQSTINGG